MRYSVHIEAEVRTTTTIELWPQDFEEAYAEGKKECTEPGDDLASYMYDFLKDRLEERVDGYDAKYDEGDLDYLESCIEDFIEEKERKWNDD